MKQPAPPGTKLHPSAGTPAATAWGLAHSTEGKFAVLLPDAFNDVSFPLTDEKTGAQVTVHLVSTQRANGVRYAAFCVPGGPAPNDFGSLGSMETVTSRRALLVDGHPALEITRGSTGVMRQITYDDRTCTLLVESQTQPATVPVDRADVQKMFDSFRLDR